MTADEIRGMQVKEAWTEMVIKGLKGANPEQFLARLLANMVEGMLDMKEVLAHYRLIEPDETAPEPEGPKEVGN